MSVCLCHSEVHINYLTNIRNKAIALFSVVASVVSLTHIESPVKKVSMRPSRSDKLVGLSVGDYG